METHPDAEEMWRAELTGKSPRLRHLRLWLKLLPSEPRCKLCNAPFHGLGRPIAAILGRQRSRKNPRFCNYCETIAPIYRGGAEVELTLLFVDVRGSTTLAERVTPSKFSRLMNRFYDVATRVLIDSDAWIDKLVGDEVIAFYLPFLEDHPARGLSVGRLQYQSNDPQLVQAPFQGLTLRAEWTYRCVVCFQIKHRERFNGNPQLKGDAAAVHQHGYTSNLAPGRGHEAHQSSHRIAGHDYAHQNENALTPLYVEPRSQRSASRRPVHKDRPRTELPGQLVAKDSIRS